MDLDTLNPMNPMNPISPFHKRPTEAAAVSAGGAIRAGTSAHEREAKQRAEYAETPAPEPRQPTELSPEMRLLALGGLLVAIVVVLSLLIFHRDPNDRD